MNSSNSQSENQQIKTFAKLLILFRALISLTAGFQLGWAFPRRDSSVFMQNIQKISAGFRDIEVIISKKLIKI